jgi:hypothetical protein
MLNHYPYIMYYSAKHRFGECCKKIEVQHMFRTKLVSSNVITTSISFKLDNVLTNVVVAIITHSQ